MVSVPCMFTRDGDECSFVFPPSAISALVCHLHLSIVVSIYHTQQCHGLLLHRLKDGRVVSGVQWLQYQLGYAPDNDESTGSNCPQEDNVWSIIREMRGTTTVLSTLSLNVSIQHLCKQHTG